MIKKSVELCKCFHKFNKENEFQLYTTLKFENNLISSACPSCGAPAWAFHKDGHYKRQFICYQDNKVVYHEIMITCVECSSCGHSHAILPNYIIPYSSYSIGFIVNLLYEYLTNQYKTIEELCTRFEISIPTFYRIYNCFKSDSILIKSIATTLEYLSTLELATRLFQMLSNTFYSILTQFSCVYGYSFMQQRNKIRLMNVSTDPPTYTSR